LDREEEIFQEDSILLTEAAAIAEEEEATWLSLML
jgi:hypothetical protein